MSAASIRRTVREEVENTSQAVVAQSSTSLIEIFEERAKTPRSKPPTHREFFDRLGESLHQYRSFNWHYLQLIAHRLLGGESLSVFVEELRAYCREVLATDFDAKVRHCFQVCLLLSKAVGKERLDPLWESIRKKCLGAVPIGRPSFLRLLAQPGVSFNTLKGWVQAAYGEGAARATIFSYRGMNFPLDCKEGQRALFSHLLREPSTHYPLEKEMALQLIVYLPQVLAQMPRLTDRKAFCKALLPLYREHAEVESLLKLLMRQNSAPSKAALYYARKIIQNQWDSLLGVASQLWDLYRPDSMSSSDINLGYQLTLKMGEDHLNEAMERLTFLAEGGHLSSLKLLKGAVSLYRSIPASLPRGKKITIVDQLATLKSQALLGTMQNIHLKSRTNRHIVRAIHGLFDYLLARKKSLQIHALAKGCVHNGILPGKQAAVREFYEACLEGEEIPPKEIWDVWKRAVEWHLFSEPFGLAAETVAFVSKLKEKAEVQAPKELSFEEVFEAVKKGKAPFPDAQKSLIALIESCDDPVRVSNAIRRCVEYRKMGGGEIVEEVQEALDAKLGALLKDLFDTEAFEEMGYLLLSLFDQKSPIVLRTLLPRKIWEKEMCALVPTQGKLASQVFQVAKSRLGKGVEYSALVASLAVTCEKHVDPLQSFQWIDQIAPSYLNAKWNSELGGAIASCVRGLAESGNRGEAFKLLRLLENREGVETATLLAAWQACAKVSQTKEEALFLIRFGFKKEVEDYQQILELFSRFRIVELPLWKQFLRIIGNLRRNGLQTDVWKAFQMLELTPKLLEEAPRLRAFYWEGRISEMDEAASLKLLSSKHPFYQFVRNEEVDPRILEPVKALFVEKVLRALSEKDVVGPYLEAMTKLFPKPPRGSGAAQERYRRNNFAFIQLCLRAKEEKFRALGYAQLKNSFKIPVVKNHVFPFFIKHVRQVKEEDRESHLGWIVAFTEGDLSHVMLPKHRLQLSEELSKWGCENAISAASTLFMQQMIEKWVGKKKGRPPRLSEQELVLAQRLIDNPNPQSFYTFAHFLTCDEMLYAFRNQKHFWKKLIQRLFNEGGCDFQEANVSYGFLVKGLHLLELLYEKRKGWIAVDAQLITDACLSLKRLCGKEDLANDWIKKVFGWLKKSLMQRVTPSNVEEYYEFIHRFLSWIVIYRDEMRWLIFNVFRLSFFTLNEGGRLLDPKRAVKLVEGFILCGKWQSKDDFPGHLAQAKELFNEAVRKNIYCRFPERFQIHGIMTNALEGVSKKLEPVVAHQIVSQLVVGSSVAMSTYVVLLWKQLWPIFIKGMLHSEQAFQEILKHLRASPSCTMKEKKGLYIFISERLKELLTLLNTEAVVKNKKTVESILNHLIYFVEFGALTIEKDRESEHPDPESQRKIVNLCRDLVFRFLLKSEFKTYRGSFLQMCRRLIDQGVFIDLKHAVLTDAHSSVSIPLVYLLTLPTWGDLTDPLKARRSEMVVSWFEQMGPFLVGSGKGVLLAEWEKAKTSGIVDIEEVVRIDQLLNS